MRLVLSFTSEQLQLVNDGAWNNFHALGGVENTRAKWATTCLDAFAKKSVTAQRKAIAAADGRHELTSDPEHDRATITVPGWESAQVQKLRLSCAINTNDRFIGLVLLTAAEQVREECLGQGLEFTPSPLAFPTRFGRA